ncbi:MAG: zf-TFIIB domain-containing protein [Proteobacteria bacterium]|nr:zf-TFIIB domain-containing protein [Pseudomonadota bacterium]
MNCRCRGSRMRPYEKHGVQIEVCPGCRGGWLDWGELEKLLDAEARYGSASPVEHGHGGRGHGRFGDREHRGRRDRDRHGSHGHGHDGHGRSSGTCSAPSTEEAGAGTAPSATFARGGGVLTTPARGRSGS